MKKEEIAVKLTINNLRKVLKTLNEYKQEYCTHYTTSSLQPIISKFEKLYLFYSTDFKAWDISSTKPQGRTLIKPKQLKELLENKSPYASNYWENQFWKGQGLYTIFDPNSEFSLTKGSIGNKGMEYIPENKTLEVGKWYKYSSLLSGKFMFMFMGDDKAIGFDINGEYCDNISIYYTIAEIFQEVSHQEVIEAFIYHMETFVNKRKNITTAELRDILNQFHREEISFSKVVELVNKGGK